MVLEDASAFARQRHRNLARARHTNRLDQALLAQVAQIAGPWIERAVVLVAEITAGDHSKPRLLPACAPPSRAACTRERGRERVRARRRAAGSGLAKTARVHRQC